MKVHLKPSGVLENFLQRNQNSGLKAANHVSFKMCMCW
jgi:hypothetical protein